MLDRALAEARGTRQQAGRVLDDAGDEAQQAQLRESRQGMGGGGTATTTIDRTGGYNDYLKLKLKAEGQYQAALRGGRGVTGMLRRQRAQQAGVSEAWTQQGDQQEAAEARALAQSEAGRAGYTRLGAEEKTRGDAKRTAEEQRRQEDEAGNLRMREAFKKQAFGEQNFKNSLFADPIKQGAMRASDRQRAAQGYLSTFQRGMDNQGFDPFSKEGRLARTAAYWGHNDDSQGRNPFAPNGELYGRADRGTVTPNNYLSESEKRWGSYGKK